MKTERDFQYEGFSSPNGTIVPDDVFDVLMPQLSDCELRVLLYIIRRTFGFKKDQDDISLRQMVEGIRARDGRVLDRGTGLSKPTVARGLAGLRDKGIIVAERNRSAERGNEATTYRLRFRGEEQQAAALVLNRQLNDTMPTPLSQQRDKGVSHQRDKGLSQQRDTQQTGEQQTDFDLSKFERSHDRVDKSERRRSRQQQIVAAAPERPNPVRQVAIEPELPGRAADAPPPAGYAALGELIEQRRRRADRPSAPRRGRSPGSSEDREHVAAFLADWAAELGDEALPSSITRVLTIFQQAGVPSERWGDLLYQARAVTKEHTAQIRKKPSDPKRSFAAKNRMPYFLAVLEQLVGLRPAPATPSPPTDHQE